MSGITIDTPRKVALSEILAQQNRERGLEPMQLEEEKLIQRVKDGGHSGQFLADAFISAYRTDQPFNHSLSELIRLDEEAFKLFHQILHIRHVSGWQDDDLYAIEQQIKSIQQENSKCAF